MGVLPMFPLGTVLLPGGVLPLNIFEQRYLQMFREILADDLNPPEFGVVLISRGRESGGGEERTMVATSARILDMQATPDGRYVLAAVGTDRLTVKAWLPDDPYPIADVDIWTDTDELPTDLGPLRARIARLHERVKSVNAVAAELGDPTPPPTDISTDPLIATYHLGSLAPIGAADRFRVLAAPGLSERLDVLEGAIDDVAAVLEFRRS
jgi:Lon protease-like protein